MGLGWAILSSHLGKQVDIDQFCAGIGRNGTFSDPEESTVSYWITTVVAQRDQHCSLSLSPANSGDHSENSSSCHLIPTLGLGESCAFPREEMTAQL